MRKRFVYKVSVEMRHSIFLLYISDVIYDDMGHHFYGSFFLIFFCFINMKRVNVLGTKFLTIFFLHNNFYFYQYRFKELYIYIKILIFILAKFYMIFLILIFQEDFIIHSTFQITVLSYIYFFFSPIHNERYKSYHYFPRMNENALLCREKKC